MMCRPHLGQVCGLATLRRPPVVRKLNTTAAMPMISRNNVTALIIILQPEPGKARPVFDPRQRAFNRSAGQPLH